MHLIKDIKRFLWLHDSGVQIDQDPVELLRDLLVQYEQLDKLDASEPPKKP